MAYIRSALDGLRRPCRCRARSNFRSILRSSRTNVTRLRVCGIAGCLRLHNYKCAESVVVLQFFLLFPSTFTPELWRSPAGSPAGSQTACATDKQIRDCVWLLQPAPGQSSALA